MNNRIEEFKNEQAKKLKQFEDEVKLCNDLSLDHEKVFVHSGKSLYGIGASVHFRDKMSLEDAIKQFQHFENILNPVDMVEVKGTFLSFKTRAYYDALPDDEAMKLGRMESLAPVMFELCKFGDSIKYYLKNDDQVIEFKIDLTDLRKIMSVRYQWNKGANKSKLIGTDLSVVDDAFNIFTDEGESIAEKLGHRMYDVESPSQNFRIVYRSYIETMEDFKIKWLRNWSKNYE